MTNHASSDEIQRRVDQYYLDSYALVHGQGQLGEANNTLHKKLERQTQGLFYPFTLELGSGNFEHLPWVRHEYETYLCLDTRRPAEQVMAKLTEFPKATFEVGDAQKIDLPDNSVDRIVVTCLILHLPDPAQAVMEWQRVCKPGGVIDFLVPTDPGFLARAFRKLVSERAVKKRGLEPSTYRLITAWEHISSFNRIVELSRACLEPGNSLKIRYFPFPWLPSFNLNAFAILRINVR